MGDYDAERLMDNADAQAMGAEGLDEVDVDVEIALGVAGRALGVVYPKDLVEERVTHWEIPVPTEE